MRCALAMVVLIAAAAQAGDDRTKASGILDGKRVEFPAPGVAGGAKAVLGILQSCTDESLFDADELKKAERGDHVRLAFAKPTAVTIQREKIEASEVVFRQPLNAGVFWVRVGDEWRRFAKYTSFRKAEEAAFEAWLREARPADRGRSGSRAGPGGTDLKLDFVRPAGKGPFPLVVLVHGGGWRVGSRTDYAEGQQGFAKFGFATASVQYRFAPKHTYPAQRDDIADALRFLVKNKEKYAVDPDRIGLMGASAGGHFAALKKAGATEKLIVVKGGGHDFGSWPEKDRSVGLLAAFAFLGEHTKRR
ncbi:MAG: alpha/beta hydrolase fold domain-containing protein [Planctomycetia bacterium]